MTNMTDDRFARSEDQHPQPSESFDFSAPLGTSESGRLIFASAAAQLELSADPFIPGLYQAQFRKNIPHIGLQKNIVTIQCGHFPFPEKQDNASIPLGKIRLNSSIPWEIEFHKGVSYLHADLSQLQFRSLDILEGAYQIELVLPRPSGTSFVYISGSLSRGLIHVPPAAGIKVQILGGSTNLIFEGQHTGGIGGETILESTNFESAPDRYQIEITGRASHLTIEQFHPPF